MFVDNVFGLIRVAVVSIVAYGALVIVLHVAGERSLAKLNAFDLVVTVALGSTLSTVLLTKDIALVEGVLAFAMLALLQWLVARLSVASNRLGRLVRVELSLLFEMAPIASRSWPRSVSPQPDNRRAQDWRGAFAPGRVYLDNDTVVIVSASDGELSNQQALVVLVTNVEAFAPPGYATTSIHEIVRLFG